MKLKNFEYTGYKIYDRNDVKKHNQLLVKYENGEPVKAWEKDIYFIHPDEREDTIFPIKDVKWSLVKNINSIIPYIIDENFIRNPSEEELFEIFL